MDPYPTDASVTGTSPGGADVATVAGADVGGQNLVGEVMRLRREEVAHLVAGTEIHDPAAVAAGLISLVTAAGETPDPQWWDLWASSTRFDPDE